MNVLASECSSGCESGWTSYLDQSFLSENASSHSHRGDERFKGKKYRGKNEEEEEEEEDLSMISDASSGPPHFNEEVFSHHAPKGMAKNSGKRKKKSKADRNLIDQQHHHSGFLDDTASSPVFNYSTVSLQLVSKPVLIEFGYIVDGINFVMMELSIFAAEQLQFHQQKNFNGECVGLFTRYICNSSFSGNKTLSCISID